MRTVITPDVQVRVARAALTAVPDGLKDTPFATVPAIEAELSRVLLTGGYTAGKVAFYDVTLQYSTDGGVNWGKRHRRQLPRLRHHRDVALS